MFLQKEIEKMKNYTTNINKYLSNPRKRRIAIAIMICILAISLIALGRLSAPSSQEKSTHTAETNLYEEKISETPTNDEEYEQIEDSTPVTYQVLSVTDGDTIRINYNGVSTPVRLIGVNTPETVDPRTTVECFGKEASQYLTNLLSGKNVTIEADPSQTDRDKYDRLLRYVYLNGEDVGLSIIANGYGYEYTYNLPYQKQSAYKAAQNEASSTNRGLWSPSTCNGQKEQPEQPSPKPSAPQTDCNIKGNISSSGEKIYHVPGQRYYASTKIDVSKGERYFCSEQEAVAAGWRKSKV